MSIILDGTTGITTPDLIDSSLTSGRVVYAGASGNLTGSSGLVFDGFNLGVGATPQTWTNGRALELTGLNFSTVVVNSASSNAAARNWMMASNWNAFGDLCFVQGSSIGVKPDTIKMQLDPSGNLGLGVTPSAWGSNFKAIQLGLAGSIASQTGAKTTEIANNAYNNSGWKYQASDVATLYYQYAGKHTWANAVSGTAGNAITFTETMTLDASGNLCIGRTSVYSTNAERLSVQATGNSPAILAINAAGATDYTYVSWNSATTGDNKFVGFFTEASPTLRGSIDYNRAGGVTRYNTSSDATLKNINGDAPKQISIDILNSTKIREYSWKDDATNKVQIGVIAQELHETFKGAVSVGGDKVTTDAEGNETTEYVPWAVDKTAFTFHLVAGWQEHERIIQEQQALIVSLKARLDAANL